MKLSDARPPALLGVGAVTLNAAPSRFWRVLGSAVLLSLCVCSTSVADLTAHFVTGSHVVVPAYGYGGNFNNASVTVSIDPSRTNWIAWHDHTTPDIYGTRELVGSNDWLGIDDYLFMTITNPTGISTARTRMDFNTGSGYPQGTQAVIYGIAAVAPDVRRGPYAGAILDEAGLFTSFFDNSGAGDYTFKFEFWDGYYGSYRNPDVYLLVDAETVPVPGAVLLGVLGLGTAGMRLRRRQM